MQKNLYKTGEFARLCGINKDTLFYYDKIGLLKPKVVAANGYRYYTSDQFIAYEIISVLKATGSSLKEIKGYFQCRNSESFINILKEKQEVLAYEEWKIKSMRLKLKDAVENIEEAYSVRLGEINIIEKQEEYLIVTPVDMDIDGEEYMECMREHINYCDKNDFDKSFHVGEIVLKEDMEKGCFTGKFLFSRTMSKQESERMWVKPRGLYAVKYHKGNYDSLPDVYKNMRNQIIAMGYAVDGSTYEEDMVDYISENDPDKYIFKIEMKIK